MCGLPITHGTYLDGGDTLADMAKKRFTCEAGYSKTEATREAAKLASRGYETKVKPVSVANGRVVRGGVEYALCWRR